MTLSPDLARPSTAAAGQLIELASGIDALYLTGRSTMPSSMLGKLQAGKESARGSGGEPFSLDGESFTLAGSGLAGRWTYRLDHAHGVVGLTASKHIPMVTVQPLASFLHAVGPTEAIGWFRRILAAEFGHVDWTVSRVDIFSDWQGWDLSKHDLDRFSCRAQEETDHKVHGDLTGVGFGKRKTGTVSARIYDKTAEIAKKGTDWWPDVWGDAYRPGERVLRVEFEIGRSGLREFGQVSPSQVIGDAGALWASVTEDWLTFREPTGDKTRSRWPIAPEWRAIQQATIRGHAVGLDRVRSGRTSGSLRLLMPTLFGALTTFGAILEVYDLDTVLSWLHYYVRQYELDADKLFSDRAFGKRLLLDEP